MTPVETRILVSSVDRDFVQRLRDLQHSELTKAFDITARDVIAKTVYQPAIEEELERRREKWGFDGSVILGRIDTATRRLYIGTRRVLQNGEPILHSIDEPEVAELAAASAANPGQVLLKRQLRVDGWTITESTTEFDNRPAPVAPGHSARSRRSRTWSARRRTGCAADDGAGTPAPGTGPSEFWRGNSHRGPAGHRQLERPARGRGANRRSGPSDNRPRYAARACGSGRPSATSACGADPSGGPA